MHCGKTASDKLEKLNKRALRLIFNDNANTYATLLEKFCLTITELFSPFYLEEMKNYWSLNVSRAVSQVIMQVHQPKVEYKLALQEKPQGSILTMGRRL